MTIHEQEPVWEHLVEGIDNGWDYSISVSVEYTIVNDEGELAADIVGIYVDEWVNPYGWLVESIREYFYDDWAQGRVKLLL